MPRRLHDCPSGKYWGYGFYEDVLIVENAGRHGIINAAELSFWYDTFEEAQAAAAQAESGTRLFETKDMFILYHDDQVVWLDTFEAAFAAAQALYPVTKEQLNLERAFAKYGPHGCT